MQYLRGACDLNREDGESNASVYEKYGMYFNTFLTVWQQHRFSLLQPSSNQSPTTITLIVRMSGDMSSLCPKDT